MTEVYTTSMLRTATLKTKIGTILLKIQESILEFVFSLLVHPITLKYVPYLLFIVVSMSCSGEDQGGSYDSCGKIRHK